MRLRTLALAAMAALTLALAGCEARKTAATGPGANPSRDRGVAGAERRAVGELRIENIPDVPKDVAARLAQYQNVRRASIVDWMPDSSGMLIATRFGNTAQLHTLAMPMGARKQLTFFEEPLSNGEYTRDGSAILYSQDIGGNEQSQIYRLDLKNSTSTMLTDGVSRHGGPLLSRTSDLIAFSNNARNGKDTDIYLQDLGSSEPARLFHSPGGSWWASDFSDDDRRLLIGTYRSVVDSMAYLADVATGENTPIITLPEGTTASVGDATFDRRNSGGIFFVTDVDSEFQRLHYRHPDGTIEVLTPELQWDIDSYELSDDGRWLAFLINAGGMSELYLHDLQSGERIPLNPGEVGVYYGMKFSPDSKRLALAVNGGRIPGDIFTYEIADGNWIRWTESEIGGMNTDSLVPAQKIQYSSFDGKIITSFYYRPEGPGPHPVLIIFHGGPESQSQPYFVPFYQYLVRELGIAVLLPNVRGSTGYGKTFVTLDDGFKREDSVKDGGALLDWIAARPELDGDRVGVYGGSYGGYMTLAMLTNYPTRIRAGMDSVGISNFVTFLTNTADYRRDLRRAEYGDERDPAMRAHLEAISPTTNAHKIRSALFVIQGFNDPRVPWTEAEQIVRVVRENGVPVWYLLGMNEGHGFARKENRDYEQQAQVLFLQKYLLGDGN